MLWFLVNIKSFISDAFMDDIAYTIYQIKHLHVDTYFIQQKKGYKLPTICKNYYVSKSADIYISGEGNTPH